MRDPTDPESRTQMALAYLDEADEVLENYGFSNHQGEFTLFMQDPEILEQLDSTKLQIPGISIKPTEIYDSLKLKKQDEIELKFTSFIKYQDSSMKGSAITVIPLEIKYVFRAAF